ncbi:MAG: hypothetical protein D6767_03655 [Candidatus Hydrogenedentota bacterium]|nr:MAG: hypothetical protein D6767_03655 [Candidatus Hydrogenedentota bacterium]
MKKLILFVFLLGCFTKHFFSLPLYSARSARVCDNCHSSPFATKRFKAWTNPALPKRKCNLSCQTCHVQPSGGGLRTVAGRYYAASTLPAFGARRRPYHDKKRNLIKWLTKKETPSSSKQKAPTKKANETTVEKQTRPDVQTKFFYPQDWLSFYHPIGIESSVDQSEYAMDYRRYGNFNADPMLTLGADVRSTFYSAAEMTKVFPMQFDVGAAFHPVEHITVSSTAGLQGRSSGLQDTLSDPENKPAKIQNAFVMLHEFPMQAYLMAGYFLPEFGVRFDDHTLYTRRPFEMDTSLSGNPNMVRGIQAGMAPNYPYFSVSYFQTQNAKHEATGTGYTVNLIWRDIAYGGGFSWMQKMRKYADGGNLSALSTQAYYNLWHLFPKLRYSAPITILTEYVIGKKPRTSLHDKYYSAWLLETDYLIINGLNLRLTYEFFDEDWKLKDDAQSRIHFGFDFTFYRGFRWTFDWRNLFAAGGEPASELIMFLHGYL